MLDDQANAKFKMYNCGLIDFVVFHFVLVSPCEAEFIVWVQDTGKGCAVVAFRGGKVSVFLFN